MITRDIASAEEALLLRLAKLTSRAFSYNLSAKTVSINTTILIPAKGIKNMPQSWLIESTEITQDTIALTELISFILTNPSSTLVISIDRCFTTLILSSETLHNELPRKSLLVRYMELYYVPCMIHGLFAAFDKHHLNAQLYMFTPSDGRYQMVQHVVTDSELLSRVTASIKKPVPSLIQKGQTCGLFSADYCARHHFAKNAGLFASEPLPPCKKKSAKSSLRAIAKSRGLTIIGEIFTAEKEAEIVKLTGCTPQIVDVKNDYQHFITTLRNAAADDCPVIFPNNNQMLFSATHHFTEPLICVHWAVITNFDEKSQRVEIKDNQQTYYIAAKHVFAAFTPVFPEYPETTFVKKGSSWSKSVGAVSDNNKVRKIPSTDLSNFWGKLIVVRPPISANADTEALKVSF